MKKTMMFLLLAVLLAGCTNQSDMSEISEKAASDAALDFIKKSPTYRWDGVKDSLTIKKVESLDCSGCYEITITFQCAQGGFGDRTGLMVTQAVTPHTARVVVENGLVTSAILDESWDEINQKEIKITPPPTIQKPYDTSFYLFINFWTEKKGRIISGDVPRIMIDFPTYSFDEISRKLEGLINFQINDSLIAIIGIGQNLSGDAGGGAASLLYGIYALPYEEEAIKIERILPDGTAEILFQGRIIILHAGEEWNKTEAKIEDVGGGRIEYTITYTIKNHGWILKSNIRKNP